MPTCGVFDTAGLCETVISSLCSVTSQKGRFTNAVTAWQFEVRRVNTGIQVSFYVRDFDLSWSSISTVIWLLVAMSGAYSTWTASHCQLSVIK